MRVRDYISHVEAKVNNDAWTVTTKMDTITLKNWLSDASAYQIALNNDKTTYSAILPEPI